MGFEIERKFLVNKERWNFHTKDKGEEIIQGYLCKNPEQTIRIRVKGESGFITVKGKTEGISRLEFEYLIPKLDAEEMIKHFCDRYIHKIRYTLTVGTHIWEVDEFIAPNKGLILAEIELKDQDEAFILPEWIEKEVSNDPAYFNANML